MPIVFDSDWQATDWQVSDFYPNFMNEETEAQSKITHSESGRTTSKPVSSDPKPTFLTTLLSSIYGSGRSLGDRNGHAFQYSCLGNPLDREAWQATVGGVAKSWT